ncbi:hypothetical protein [Paraburkholderia sacchari]|uniref:hypothetical protein n=1 Tax=Paraburkholderia sacchari TaxID=159450 RepID=UPI001BCC2B1D|nr:hypothetical protein [Paraburkholderia sacchari]
MRSYREMERELLHIRAAIALLEQTRAYLSLRMPINDPAYWKARLKLVLDEQPRDLALEKQAVELLARMHRLQTENQSGKIQPDAD